MACKLKKGKITACAGLSGVVDNHGRGTKLQGVKMQTLVDLKTFKFSRNIAILKSGKHGKNGIVMNFCPFCGKEIYREGETALSAGQRGS